MSTTLIFLVCAGLFATLSAAAVIWPLRMRNRATLDRRDSALAIFRDQLAEVDRDAARGVISQAEAEAAKSEIKRRILAADRDTETAGRSDRGAGALIAMACLLPLGAGLLYNAVGAPGVPAMPFAERQQGEAQDQTELNNLIAELRSRLEADPEGGETRGWLLLGETLMNQNRYGEAAAAFEAILGRDDVTSGSWSRYAEALIAAEGGIVTTAAERAIDRALEIDPANPAGTFYRARMLDQSGQTVEARQILLARIAAERAPQPWMEVFLQEANRMGEGFGLDPVGLPAFPEAPPGPSAEDLAAAQDMSPEEQAEFVNTMVEGLAARLAEAPEDVEGWLQLARAYDVLGRRADAVEALRSAEPFVAGRPEDDPLRQAVEAGLRALAPE